MTDQITVSVDGIVAIAWVRFWRGLLKLPLVGVSIYVVGGGWLRQFILNGAEKLLWVQVL